MEVHEATNSQALQERPRIDALPEHTRYEDTGCPDGRFLSCLNCPLERCRYDTSGGMAAALRSVRATRIESLRDHGSTRSEIAALLGISIRTVNRALAGAHAA